MKENKSPAYNKGSITSQTSEDRLTPRQKETWNNIKQGFMELKMVEEGKAKSRPAEELLGEI
jgi:hypothetical protein